VIRTSAAAPTTAIEMNTIPGARWRSVDSGAEQFGELIRSDSAPNTIDVRVTVFAAAWS